MQLHVLVAIFFVGATARCVFSSKGQESGKVSINRSPGSHLVVVANATLKHGERVDTFDTRPQLETNGNGNAEEREMTSWMSKVYDFIGKLAMKLKLNPRLVYRLSRAGVDLETNARFVRWLQYVIEYRARKGSDTHFTDDAIYHLVKKKKSDVELLTVFQSVQQRTNVPAAKQLAERMVLHAANTLEKADWVTNSRSPHEVFRILQLGKETDFDNPLFYQWLKYIYSYNTRDRKGGTAPALFTDQELYKILRHKKSDAELTRLFDSLQYLPVFEKLAVGMQRFLAVNPASRQKMFEAWLYSTSNPLQVFYNLRLEDKANSKDELLLDWFRYLDFYWSGPEGVVRQTIFSYVDCIGLLRDTHLNEDLKTIFKSLRHDPSLRNFADFMLTQPRILKQNLEWLVSDVSPSKVFSRMKLGSELDPYNFKLHQFLKYVDEYTTGRDAAAGDHVKFTTEKLYSLLGKLKQPQDLAARMESLRQLSDVEDLAKSIQVYMVTNRATRHQVFETWLGASMDPSQVFSILCKDEHGRGPNLYGEWLGYVNFFWNRPDGVARHSDFNHDDSIGMLRSISKSDDDVEMMLNSVREEPGMKEFADDMVTYLKIVQHKSKWLQRGLGPVEAYHHLELGVEADPNHLRFRQWLSYVYTYKKVGRNAALRIKITDRVVFNTLKLMFTPEELVNVITSLRRVPYMTEIASRLEVYVRSDAATERLASNGI